MTSGSRRTYIRDAFCSYCGDRHTATNYPRLCARCAQTTYRNPLPVAVTIVPVDGGVLAVRRGISPGEGQLAFPGGYIECGESWQAGGAREILEETGITVDASSIRLFAVKSAPEDDKVLIFGISAPLAPQAVKAFAPTQEAPEIEIVRGEIELAFPLHTEALREFFSSGFSSQHA